MVRQKGEMKEQMGVIMPLAEMLVGRSLVHLKSS